MSDAAGSEAWMYYYLSGGGTGLTDQRTTNSITKTASYAYNYDGTTNTLTYPVGGRTVTYYPTRTLAGSQPYQAADTTNSINYVASAIFEASGQLASLNNGATLTSTLFYNSSMQPCRTSVNTTSGSAPNSCTDSSHSPDVMDLTYGFNFGTADNGDVARVGSNLSSNLSFSYSYDSLNRVYTAYTDATSGSTCHGETFTVDAWSNLTTIGDLTGYTGTGCTRENLGLTVGANNQISTSGFAYDAAGNLTSDGTISAYYDSENRVCSLGGSSCSTGTIYTYDGDGRRVEKSSGTLYWYDTNGNVLDETDGSGNLSYEYVFFDGKRIAQRDSSSNLLYFFTDHLGNTRAVYNANTSTASSCDYYPFGGEVATCFSGATNYKFTGKERDSESGLDNFGARYMSSQYGRFMTPDWASDPEPVPYADLKYPQSLNLYAYVRNNPLSRRDVDGHRQVCDPDTYSTGPDGELIVKAGACHEVADPAQMQTESLYDVLSSLFGRGSGSGSSSRRQLLPTLMGQLRTPNKGGPPNGRVFYPNNNPKTGVKGGTLRHFDENGRAEKDIDFGHDHTGAGDPHAHDWNGDDRGDERTIGADEPIYATPGMGDVIMQWNPVLQSFTPVSGGVPMAPDVEIPDFGFAF